MAASSYTYGGPLAMAAPSYGGHESFGSVVFLQNNFGKVPKNNLTGTVATFYSESKKELTVSYAGEEW